MMATRRSIRLVLGAAVWLTALTGLLGSVLAVQSRASRPVRTVLLSDSATSLQSGDIVYRRGDSGLESIGEVATTPDGVAVLSIRPDAAPRLNSSTRAVVWRTPLSAEQALEALLPPDIQREAARRIAEDWEAHAPALTAEWTPILADLVGGFFDVVRPDFEAAMERHRDELQTIAAWHGRALGNAWPDIQARVQPIVQEHLTPVLARMMNQALADAPKVTVAWEMARGNHTAAYKHMLDWMADYLANLPRADRAELRQALAQAWEVTRTDPELVEIATSLGRDLLNDQRISDVLGRIYREAVTDNPNAIEYLQRAVLDSPEVRQRFYAFVERFAPTARNVTALCLFDEEGATRPEIVHLVRSIALQRSVAWVTLETPDPTAPALQEIDTLPTDMRGATP